MGSCWKKLAVIVFGGALLFAQLPNPLDLPDPLGLSDSKGLPNPLGLPDPLGVSKPSQAPAARRGRKHHHPKQPVRRKPRKFHKHGK